LMLASLAPQGDDSDSLLIAVGMSRPLTDPVLQ
jgi:hypothetical protein